MYTLKVKTIQYDRQPGDETIILTCYLADTATGIPINEPNTSTTTVRTFSVRIPKSSLPMSGYLAHIEDLTEIAMDTEFDFSFQARAEDGLAQLTMVDSDVAKLLRTMALSGPGFDLLCAVETIMSATTVALSDPIDLSFVGDFADPTVSQNGDLVTTSYTVTNLSDTSVLTAGMAVSGTGLPSGCFISAILSATSVSLTQAALLTVTSSLVFSPVANSDVITNVSPTVYEGMIGLTLSGPNVPIDATVSSIISSSSLQMSDLALSQDVAAAFLMSGTATVQASMDGVVVDLSDLSRVVDIIDFAAL